MVALSAIERRGPQMGSTYEDLLESSDDFAELMRSDGASANPISNDFNNAGNIAADDGASLLADHLKNLLQQRMLLLQTSGTSDVLFSVPTFEQTRENEFDIFHIAAAGAMELINRGLDAFLPQLQVCHEVVFLSNSNIALCLLFP
jgi:hypothetical protein